MNSYQNPRSGIESLDHTRRKNIEALKESWIGIAAFSISIISVLTMFTAATLVVSFKEEDPESTIYAFTGFSIFAAIFFQLIGIALGTVGVKLKNTKRLLSITGLAISSASLLLIVAVLTIGFLVEP